LVQDKPSRELATVFPAATPRDDPPGRGMREEEEEEDEKGIELPTATNKLRVLLQAPWQTSIVKKHKLKRDATKRRRRSRRNERIARKEDALTAKHNGSQSQR
jgi:hypothetical protein